MTNKARLSLFVSRLNNIPIKYNAYSEMSNLGVPAVRIPLMHAQHRRMIKRNNDGQKSRRKKITPIIFLPSSSRGILHSATSLPFRPTLRYCYPAGCSYTMPNGRPGTPLIEISFLIEGTYLVVKAWEGRGRRREERKTMRTSTSTFLLRSFSFNRSICFLFKPPSPFYARYLN